MSKNKKMAVEMKAKKMKRISQGLLSLFVRMNSEKLAAHTMVEVARHTLLALRGKPVEPGPLMVEFKRSKLTTIDADSLVKRVRALPTPARRKFEGMLAHCVRVTPFWIMNVQRRDGNAPR